MKSSDHLEFGKVYTRQDLREEFTINDATIDTGIFRPKDHKSIWLFITQQKSNDMTQYNDRLEGEDLHIDGQSAGWKDKSLIEHEKNNDEVLLFFRRTKTEHPGGGFRYEGQFRYVSHTGTRPAHFHFRRVEEIAKKRIQEYEIAKGFEQLNELSLTEYREPIGQLIQGVDPQRGALRLGRLVGVLLKEPFALPVQRQQPSSRTGAYREWHLLARDDFERRPADTWQFLVLNNLKNEIAKEDIRVASMNSLYTFAQDAHHETGFFTYFAQNLRRYICGDKKTRTKVDEAIKKMKASEIPKVTPESIVSAGGLSLGAYLVHIIPILGYAGAPVIAGIVLILYTLGVDAFCKWTSSLNTAAEEQQ